MAKVFKAPIEAPAFNMDTWREDEAKYIADVKARIPKANTGEFVGEIVRFAKGDGYAQYIVWKQNPLELIWLEVGDKWQADDATIRGLRLSDIETQVKRSRFFAEESAKKERFYDNLPIGTVVHYDNGFANFVRCVRVEGPKGRRLRAVALVGNWQAHDLPQRRRDGTVDYRHHGTRIKNGEGFEPNAGSIWENMDEKTRAYAMRSCKPPGPEQRVNFPRYEAPFDPTTAEPLPLEPPEPSVAEKRLAFHERRLAKLRETMDRPTNTVEDYEGLFRDVAAALLSQEA